MGIFGNLDNLNLGMGLKVNELQFIPTKYASLDGLSLFSEQEKSQKVVFGVLGALLLLLIIIKLR